ncbi:MAG TPA: Mur ligase family protein [Coxiellaceae bacterium]|nr:Mur ligase family protein [Coxiellaceae bacterium]
MLMRTQAPDSLETWLAYIEQIHPQTINLGLDRIRPIAKSLQLTNFYCPVVIIGGTNGKGSTVRFLETILLKAGYSVGAYTSPHLLHFKERLRINNQTLSPELWVAAFEVIEKARDTTPLTFFEFTTLAALYLCRYSRDPQPETLDILLLEVGLGGRLDAVNMVEPDISVITSIELDHLDYLGPTRELIAIEKLGISRPLKPLILGSGAELTPIKAFALKHQGGFYAYGKNLQIEQSSNSWFLQTVRGRTGPWPIPPLALRNAALALQVLECLHERMPVSSIAITEGLRDARLAGRQEWREQNGILYCFDVSHNSEAIHYLATHLKVLPCQGKTYGIAALLSDKAVSALTPMVPLVDEWYLPYLRTPRAQLPEVLHAHLKTEQAKRCYTVANVEEALSALSRHLVAGDRVIIFGSFYTVAAAKQALHHED